MNCHYFNPENDLALAHGTGHYNAPASAVRLATDLSLLPLWFAQNGEIVLTRNHVPRDWQADVLAQLGIAVEWTPFEERIRHQSADDILVPWGWNESLVKEWNKYAKEKISVDTGKLRELSHRRFSITTLKHLENNGLLPTSFTMPQELTTLQEIRQFIESNHHCVLKSPWSCSGKGLRWIDGCWESATEAWCANVLARQHSVVGEVTYEKETDFALEFLCDGKAVSFAGYSLFSADKTGTYRSNHMMSNKLIEKKLCDSIDGKRFLDIAQCLSSFFSQTVAPYYQGYFGVDMMIVREGEKKWIHPCVEVNLRMNMGVCARIITDRYLSPSSVGEFVIWANKSSDGLAQICSDCSRNYPLVIQDGKIRSGFLPLTFVGENARYAATIHVKDAL